MRRCLTPFCLLCNQTSSTHTHTCVCVCVCVCVHVVRTYVCIPVYHHLGPYTDPRHTWCEYPAGTLQSHEEEGPRVHDLRCVLGHSTSPEDRLEHGHQPAGRTRREKQLCTQTYVHMYIRMYVHSFKKTHTEIQYIRTYVCRHLCTFLV